MNNYQQHNQHTTEQRTQNTTNFQQSNQTQQQPSIITKLINSCLPVVLEQFMGQTMPPMGGNNSAETQLALSQIITLQNQIVTSQQELTRRIGNLEMRVSQQFSGLVQQVKNLGSVRLSHERESKRIEFNNNGNGNFQHQQETN